MLNAGRCRQIAKYLREHEGFIKGGSDAFAFDTLQAAKDLEAHADWLDSNQSVTSEGRQILYSDYPRGRHD